MKYCSVHVLIGYFYVLAIVNDTAIIIGVHIFLDIVISFPSDILPELEFLDHKVVLFLTFWATYRLFSLWLYQFTISSTVYKGSPSSKSLPVYLSLSFYDGHTNRNQISYCGFNVRVPCDYWCRESLCSCWLFFLFFVKNVNSSSLRI